jgi:hypothetical protein
MEPFEAAVDTWAGRYIESERLPSLALAVIRKGNSGVVFRKSYSSPVQPLVDGPDEWVAAPQSLQSRDRRVPPTRCSAMGSGDRSVLRPLQCAWLVYLCSTLLSSHFHIATKAVHWGLPVYVVWHSLS